MLQGMYRVHLTDEQRQELKRRTHQVGLAPSTRDRLEMVRLADAGWSVPRIARHLGQHEQTVRAWVKAFLRSGFEALGNKPRPGQTSALTPTMVAALHAEVEKGERIWTASQLVQWVAVQHGVRLSEGRLRLHLRRAGLSWQRTSRDLGHKQKPAEVAEKQATLQGLQKGGTPG